VNGTGPSRLKDVYGVSDAAIHDNALRHIDVVDLLQQRFVHVGEMDVGVEGGVDLGQVESVEVRRLERLAPGDPSAVDPNAIHSLPHFRQVQVVHYLRQMLQHMHVVVLLDVRWCHRPADDVIDAILPRPHSGRNGIPRPPAEDGGVDSAGIRRWNSHPLEVGPLGGQLPRQPIVQSDASILIDGGNEFQARVFHGRHVITLT